jgi:hypothetical protein
MRTFKIFGTVLLIAIVSVLVQACGGGGGGDSSSGGSGTLSLSMTDASVQGIKAVYVTIDEIQVHLGGNENVNSSWGVIAAPQKTYNLHELVNGVREELGLVSLEPGQYTQMRLIIGSTADDTINILSQPHPYANYVIDAGDQSHQLKIPSGFQTGYKIVHGFTINENQTTELILDFDASRSVVRAGNSGQWLLKPTIKVVELREYAIVRGFVGIEGALVSMQEHNPQAPDAADQVSVQTATVSGLDGGYEIFVEPGVYNVVVSADGFDPVCAQISLAAGDVVPDRNFTLSAANTEMQVTGSVQITGATDEQHATLSFRQLAACGGSAQDLIEVQSVNIANLESYVINLPAGDYSLVASSFDRTTDSRDISPSPTGEPITENIVLNR